jgi:hypothetical protein
MSKLSSSSRPWREEHIGLQTQADQITCVQLLDAFCNSFAGEAELYDCDGLSSQLPEQTAVAGISSSRIAFHSHLLKNGLLKITFRA